MPSTKKVVPEDAEAGVATGGRVRHTSLAEEIPPRQRRSSIVDELGRGVRPPMNQVEFDEKFSYKQPEKQDEFIHHAKKFVRRFTFPFTSLPALRVTALSFFPIISWMRDYSWKENIVNDIIGGLTVGIMHVPQGIAYSVLAKVAPVNGLYTSLFPPLLYMIFGMSRHNSIGSFAVVSLMTGMAVERITQITAIQENTLTEGDPAPFENVSPSEVAAALTLGVGLVQFLMAVAGLDFLTTYFSDQVVGGFTTGASCHVFVSQIKDIVGLRRMPKRSGPGYLIMMLYDIFVARVMDINIFSLVVSLLMMTFLIVGKDVVNPWIKRRFKLDIPIPFELIVVISGTIFSYIFDFAGQHNMKIAKAIPTGVPEPSFPNLRLLPSILPEAASIAIVAMAVHISLAKMYAKKQNYEVEPGQELYALGFSAFGSSFFPCYPAACSLGRTIVNVAAGTKTQFSTIFSSIFVLSVILYFARFLETLPMCALSAIVLVALKGMFSKFADLRLLWPVSKIDFSIWIVSFLATALIDVTEGLAISIGYALFTTIMREQWPRWHLLGNVEGTTDYRDSERYENVSYYNGICVFRFDSPLLFTNVESFKLSVKKAFCAWQASHEYYVHRSERPKLLMEIEDEEKGEFSEDEKKENADEVSDTLQEPEPELLSRHFIIECSGFTFVDYMGVSALKEIFSEMKSCGVQVYFASAKAPVREMFESSGFFVYVPKEHFYPTIRDAVAIARLRQKQRGAPSDAYHLEHDRLSGIISSHPMN